MAYKRIVDRLRAKGREYCLCVQSTGFISGQEHLKVGILEMTMLIGVVYLSSIVGKKLKCLNLLEKGRPVFIAEATPTISDYGGKLYGLTKETQLSNPEQADEAWEKWFLPFEAVEQNKDVVKAVHYINCHWDSHPMWYENPTFKGVDASSTSGCVNYG